MIDYAYKSGKMQAERDIAIDKMCYMAHIPARDYPDKFARDFVMMDKTGEATIKLIDALQAALDERNAENAEP